MTLKTAFWKFLQKSDYKILHSRACFRHRSFWYWDSRELQAYPWGVAANVVGSWSLWMRIDATELFWGRVTCWHRPTWSLGLQHLWMGLLRLLWKNEAQKSLVTPLSWQAERWRWQPLGLLLFIILATVSSSWHHNGCRWKRQLKRHCWEFRS